MQMHLEPRQSNQPSSCCCRSYCQRHHHCFLAMMIMMIVLLLEKRHPIHSQRRRQSVLDAVACHPIDVAEHFVMSISRHHHRCLFSGYFHGPWLWVDGRWVVCHHVYTVSLFTVSVSRSFHFFKMQIELWSLRRNVEAELRTILKYYDCEWNVDLLWRRMNHRIKCKRSSKYVGHASLKYRFHL